MAFKDKMDIWSEEEDFEPMGWGMRLLLIVLIVPWLIGLGALFNYFFDSYLW